MTTPERLHRSATRALPEHAPDIVEWSEQFVRLANSAKSERFKSSISPWVIAPMRSAVTNRLTTFVKPVQVGGSTAGECWTCYVARWGRGNLQINWENDKKARLRWDSRIQPILKNCEPLNYAELERFEAVRGQVRFHNVFLTNQGVYVEANLDSESIHYQYNEEIHSWPPGHLEKARNRQRMVWNAHSFDVSNASQYGDQLHQAFDAGTRQRWQVRCPGCGEMHAMRTRWEPKKPKLGGLRYDADGCRRPNGEYDYTKLKPTIFFQMPCGFRVHDDIVMRRQLSGSGDYSAPENESATGYHHSYTLDSVAVDSIDWLEMIRQKHRALRARKYGDLEPWIRYVTEIECSFYEAEDVPVVGNVVLSDSIKKSRDGLPDRAARLFSLDYQKGQLRDGETKHWWLVIRDFKANGDSLLVWEGKLLTDGEVEHILREHDCRFDLGVADSGHDAKHVYGFSYRLGINVIKVEGREWFTHPGDGGKHIYSEEVPLHKMMDGVPPRYEADGDYDPREPMFWHVSHSGIRDALWFLRSNKVGIKHETPGDVSDDYQKHQESEAIEFKPNRDGVQVKHYVQLHARNDQLHNEASIAMLARKLGIPEMAMEGDK